MLVGDVGQAQAALFTGEEHEGNGWDGERTCERDGKDKKRPQDVHRALRFL